MTDIRNSKHLTALGLCVLKNIFTAYTHYNSFMGKTRDIHVYM